MIWKAKIMASQGRQGQVAIEYIVLLGVVTAVILFSFKNVLPVVRDHSDDFFNQTVRGVYGSTPSADPNFAAYP